MADFLELGISRNRLFSFSNTVVFCGEYKEKLKKNELEKAFKKLSYKLPFLNSFIELEETGEAKLVLKECDLSPIYLNEELNVFVQKKRESGLDFYNNLFDFFVLNENTLVIFSHTVVSDVKTLFFIAESILKYYNNETVAINEESLTLFKINELPECVNSFIAEQVAEKLDNEWEYKKCSFTVSDFQNARSAYFVKEENSFKTLKYEIDHILYEKTAEKLNELNVDFSTAVAFALFYTLSNKLKLKKSENKMLYFFDRRLSFADVSKYNYGTLNGDFFLDLPKNITDLKTALMLFQKDIYKKASDPFNSFYNEYFLSLFSPSLQDSAYMYSAGVFKNKTSKKLCNLYSCGKKCVLSFSSFNLKQKTFSGLSTLLHKMGFSPRKVAESVSATLILSEKIELYLDVYNPQLKQENIDLLFKECIKLLEKI